MRFVAGILAIAILGLAPTGWAATREFVLEWSQECMTTEGDDLDLDDDGICELLTGFRTYDANTTGFITATPEDGTRRLQFRFNAPWGNQCFYMTAVMDDPINSGQVLESVASNQKCVEVRPGNPNAPIIIP